MTRNPVGWFEIYVNDLERAKKFYQSVFHRPLERLGEPTAEFEMWSFGGGPDAWGCSGTICRMQGFEAGHNSTIVYFSCADCAVEEARAAQNGGKVFKPKMSIGQYGFISLVHDTEGNLIGLHSMN